MKRFVVYSAIIGQYDKPLQPLAIDERFDYVLFSDFLPEGKEGAWQVKRIDYSNPVQSKIARYVKTHPESLLPEYEASLWMDANIRIASNFVYDRFIELFETDAMIAGVKHLAYDCVYEEMFSVLDFLYEREGVVLDWGHFLRDRKFPKHAGMFETGLLFRKHSKEEVVAFDSIWWNYIEKYSKRDQLSFTVALKDANLQCDYYIPDGYTVRNHEGFVFVKHMNEKSKFGKTDETAWLMHHYYKHHEDREKVAKLYYWIYGRRHPSFWAKVLGQYYRIVDRLDLKKG